MNSDTAFWGYAQSIVGSDTISFTFGEKILFEKRKTINKSYSMKNSSKSQTSDTFSFFQYFGLANLHDKIGVLMKLEKFVRISEELKFR